MPHNRVPLLGLVLLALAASAFFATQLSSGKAHQSQDNERQLEDAIPKHVPLKININKEKEAELNI